MQRLGDGSVSHPLVEVVDVFAVPLLLSVVGWHTCSHLLKKYMTRLRLLLQALGWDAAAVIVLSLNSDQFVVVLCPRCIILDDAMPTRLKDCSCEGQQSPRRMQSFGDLH